jgi:ABC-type nitrate/sulfonate/bicarbonate transport system ATPase subunit
MQPIVDIKVERVTKIFPGREGNVDALDEVSFEVERGTLFCIVGPSGCGKSTLMRLLLGIDNPTSGNIWLNPDRVSAGVALIQQSSVLLPWRTVLQNAALGLEVKGNVRREHIEYIRDEIKRVGLGGFEHTPWSELSGGMRQKVAIICALVSRPALLFCDEPFSAIDFVTRLDMNMHFKNMCEIASITTVFVTHNIEEAIFLGDRIAVMSRRPGKIVSIHNAILSKDPHDAVKCRESPEFEALFMKIWGELKR